MLIQRIDFPCLSIHSYMVGDEKTKRYAVIDPTRHVVPFIIQAQNDGFDITDIVETHVHADFVSGAKELKHQLNEKPRIYASGMGGEEWIPSYADVVVRAGTKIQIGNLRLESMHTPGHTPEHIIWVCFDETRSAETPWLVFTGDCLFVGSVGRPDLLGQNEVSKLSKQLYHSLFDTLGLLPDFVEIFPSHGAGSLCGKSLNGQASSTLGYERLFNPYFKKESEDKWITHVMSELPPAPSYFHRLKKLNVEGPLLLNSLKVLNWESKRDDPKLDDLFLLDIRHLECFAASHLKGSLNIPPSQSFCLWAGWMLPDHQPIGLIVQNAHAVSEVVEQFRIMGFDQEAWIIQFDESNPVFSYLLGSFPLIDVDHFSTSRNESLLPSFLDVRTPVEWRSGHIEGAYHIPLEELEGALDKLPREKPIVCVCKSGSRASLAASLLMKHGFPSVMNLQGGMQAWKQAGLPLSR